MISRTTPGAPRRRSAPRALASLVALCCLLSPSVLCFDAGAQAEGGEQNTSNAAPAAVAPLSPAPYAIGERLTYNVSFASFPSAAYVELAVVGRAVTTNNREAIELSAHVETTGVVSAALYAANNDYRAFVDPRTGATLRTLARTRAGGNDQGVDFARDYNQPVGGDAIPPRNSRLPVPGTFDLLSAIYRARALPLLSGTTYRFQVVAGQSTADIYDVDLRVTGRELTKTSVGSYNTIVATARPRLADAYRTRIHFTDDERRVPVLVAVEHPAGEIRAELVSSSLNAAAPANDVAAGQPPAAPPVALPAAPPSAPPTPAPANPTSAPPANADSETTPRQGDQLNYQVYLGASPQPVGAVFFEVRGRGRFFDREAVLVSATASTTGLGEQLFPVRDRFTSYLEPASLLPFRSEVELREGARSLRRTLTFDQAAGAFTREDGLRAEMPSNTYDLASLVYAVRRFDLAPPRRTSVSILASNRTHTLTLSALSRERITIGGTEVPAIQLALTTDGREPDRNGLRLWVSDDARRLPLRFTAQTPLGIARAELAIIPVVRQ